MHRCLSHGLSVGHGVGAVSGDVVALCEIPDSQETPDRNRLTAMYRIEKDESGGAICCKGCAQEVVSTSRPEDLLQGMRGPSL